MSSEHVVRWTCNRCGKEEYSEPGRLPEDWIQVDVRRYLENHVEDELCPECSDEFLYWYYDEFIKDKPCSRCTKSKRLDSGAYECLAELYDITNKTCFVPKKEVD